jgi:thioredoxin 1
MKVIKFYADWCGPCKSYAPIFDKVINETKLDFTNVNIDKDISGLAAKYKIKSIPATVFLKDDGTFTKEVGLLSESQLKQLIK